MNRVILTASFLILAFLFSGCIGSQPDAANPADNINASAGIENSQNQSPAPEKTFPAESVPFAMITPYVNEADVSSMNEAYSTSADSPWGFRHPGIDFMIDKDFVPFRAVADGIVENSNNATETNQQGYHQGFCINHAPYLICYNFETFSHLESDAKKQADNIFVVEGQEVKQGDVVGNLIVGKGGQTHVDFGIIDETRDRVCPEPYFTDDANQSIYRILNRMNSTWRMCYA